MVIIAALIGFGVLWLTVHFGNKIANRWLRYAAMLGGIIIGLYLPGIIADSVGKAMLAGEILGGLILSYWAIKSIRNKFIAILIVAILWTGAVYENTKDTIKENQGEKLYAYISYEFPGGQTILFFKRVYAQKCEKIREEYYQEIYKIINKKCPGCKFTNNDCRKNIPERFVRAFDKVEDIGQPYIFKPYKYPEIIFPVGFPEDAFHTMCNMQKESLSTTVCVD